MVKTTRFVGPRKQRVEIKPNQPSAFNALATPAP